MLFLQEGPANTTQYMLLGYGVIFGVMLIYLVSLAVRRNNVERDLALLEDLEEEESA